MIEKCASLATRISLHLTKCSCSSRSVFLHSLFFFFFSCFCKMISTSLLHCNILLSLKDFLVPASASNHFFFLSHYSALEPNQLAGRLNNIFVFWAACQTWKPGSHHKRVPACTEAGSSSVNTVCFFLIWQTLLSLFYIFVLGCIRTAQFCCCEIKLYRGKSFNRNYTEFME